MLQTISPKHDRHHKRSESTSLASLTASLSDGKKHLLLAASGSVATIKLPQIVEALASRHPDAANRLSIRIVLTQAATHFLAGQSAEQPALSALAEMPCVDAVYGDADEWGPRPWKRGGGILHIELRRWADILVIAPLSANTLAKITGGMCDNLLTSVVRAWDPDGAIDGVRKRIVVCPAMNSAMWRHPVTARQIRTLEEEWGVGAAVAAAAAGTEAEAAAADERGVEADGRGTPAVSGIPGWFEVIPPQEKLLACGDVGQGAMADWNEIVRIIELRLGLA